MEKLKELVLAYIAKTQGKTPEEVSSLLFKINDADKTEVLKDDALNSLYELDKARVQAQTQKFDTERKETYDKGYNKAKAESLSKFEKDLREKYQITEEKQGTELVDAILAKQSKDSGTGEPTEDQIRRSKTYLDTLDKLKQEKETAVKEWQTKYESREKELQTKETFKTISDQALKALKDLNPILPANEKIAKEWESIFLQRISEFEFEVKDGRTVILKKDGEGTKVLLDEHGHPVKFESLVKEKAASIFEFKEGQERKGTGNNNDDQSGSGGNKGYTGPVPKSEAEYQKAIEEAADEDTKIAITKVYTGSK